MQRGVLLITNALIRFQIAYSMRKLLSKDVKILKNI